MAKKSKERDVVVELTEKYLTRRKIKKYYKKEKQKRKNFIQDWGGALLWAACVVFLINQYLFQAYAIPSSSMVDTLRISDRLFVDKLSMGPELLPGVAKLNFKDPRRSDIIIFENPEYKSKGTFFNIAHRMLYMITFSLVDIDKEYDPSLRRKVPSKHFLIKRAAGADRDFVKIEYGDVFYKPYGAVKFYAQDCVNNDSFKPYNVVRQIPSENYREYALNEFRLLLSEEAFVDWTSSPDFTEAKVYSMFDAMINPHDKFKRSLAVKDSLGWYIPDNYKLPLGDNRDNSKDGRYFGPIADKKIIGKAGFIYWPLNRFGVVK